MSGREERRRARSVFAFTPHTGAVAQQHASLLDRRQRVKCERFAIRRRKKDKNAIIVSACVAAASLLLQIPRAFTGGAIAVDVSGVGLNATGLVAFLTLVALSLNHGIVLLFRVRRNEGAGSALADAVREAIHVRFRPIMLTTLTAVLGMLPTALGWGQGAAPEQGLAIVILGGILWSALLTTNLIPALYLYRRRHRERSV